MSGTTRNPRPSGRGGSQLRYYNTERAHTGRWTRGRTPEEVLGKAKLWHKKR